MATAEKRKRSEGSSSNIWDNFIKNPLDGSKATCRKCRQIVSCGSSTGKAKSWGNGPMWSHLKVCSATASSSSTQLNLEQTFARNIPLQKDSIKAKAITRAIETMVAVDLRPYSIVEKRRLHTAFASSRATVFHDIKKRAYKDRRSRNIFRIEGKSKAVSKFVGKLGQLYNGHVEVRGPESGIHDGNGSLGC